MSFHSWGDYVSVGEKRLQAQQALAKLRKQGRSVAPVTIEGRKIANSFWGQSWCTNLERYSDYAYRLPRGRSYVRNGFVVDLQIAKGEITARVSGSDLYSVKIVMAPVKTSRWKSICCDCAGTIDSLVELLQGRLAKGVMDRVCREGDGLFPSPEEIKLSCSCPDWADMCKHVAAALYGVGARLDAEPRLLFVLRGVDENELLAGGSGNMALARPAPSAKVLADSDVAALFGLEMAEAATSDTAALAAPKRRQRAKTAGGSKTPALKKPAAARKGNTSRAPQSKSRSKSEPKSASGTRPRTRRVQQRLARRPA
ncbi:MAG: hypothetical protein QOG83_3763 [Alphaproteobacteria bacterium]|jgi:uncharacterized Zn finger protein|nr:hypothetical protein [Alphaproteobacteria bacterium]